MTTHALNPANGSCDGSATALANSLIPHDHNLDHHLNKEQGGVEEGTGMDVLDSSSNHFKKQNHHHQLNNSQQPNKKNVIIIAPTTTTIASCTTDYHHGNHGDRDTNTTLGRKNRNSAENQQRHQLY